VPGFVYLLAGTTLKTPKVKLYYLFDPLCGWCYAFDAIIRQVSLALKGQVEVEAVSGGMITGMREGPVGAMSGFILQTLPVIEQHSGVRFGEPYLEMVREGTRFLSSIAPSRALEAFKQLVPGRSVEFANDLQRAQFVEGKDFNREETYLELIQPYGIDPEQFRQAMNAEHTLKAVH